MEEQEFFYLRDSRSNVGSSAMFWADRGGYTSNLDAAEKFTKERAVSLYNSRETDIPVPCGEVYQYSYLAIDMQYIDDDPHLSAGVDCVAYVEGRYDGNNIPFKSENGTTYMLAGANVFRYPEGMPKDGVMSLKYAESIARPVVNAGTIDDRTRGWFRRHKIKMVKKRRPPSDNNRFNCPDCGRVVWDRNPYSDGRCRDHRLSVACYE